MANLRERDWIEHNRKSHDHEAGSYDEIHPEIFNPIEQTRLASALRRASALAKGRRALDFGCGSGNLTRHLLDLGLDVTAADLSPGLLAQVRRKYGTNPNLSLSELNGRDLSQFADGSFDLVATYSVLHHIPDYLGAVAEMVRVLAPGGVLFIDHEVNENYWAPPPLLRRWQKEGPSSLLSGKRPLKSYLSLNYLRQRWIRLFNPRFSPSGDIHVWADDHIEWPRILECVESKGLRVAEVEDYLLYREGFREDLHQELSTQTSDMRLLIAVREDTREFKN